MADSFAQSTAASSTILEEILSSGSAGSDWRARIRHLEVLEGRAGRLGQWPAWVAPKLQEALVHQGISQPWAHQCEAMELAWRGQHVVLATGTGSGKSLSYLVPTVSALIGQARPGEQPAAPAGALYLAPTKALTADQIQQISTWGLAGLRLATYDGDSSTEERRWAREHANLLLSNPDMLHNALLPNHRRWAGFFRGLQFVIVDECHHYRGAFGAHLSALLRRLRRLAQHYGAAPTFVLASATIANPSDHASTLVGLPVQAISSESHGRGRTEIALWEPPVSGTGRRSSLVEIGELITEFVLRGKSTLAFVPSRRAVEQVTQEVKERLALASPNLSDRVHGYRSGYLPEDRRAIERSLRSGDCLAVVSTSALELGVNIAGLDVVLLAGWPGRRSAFWQRVGRAGRAGQDALAIYIGEDNPLDTYLLHHPEAIFGESVEAAIVDPDNPYILAPHLAAAAAEHPLTEADTALFGPTTESLLAVLVARGILRKRAQGWFWARRDRVSEHLNLRGEPGEAVRIVVRDTGRVLGTVDQSAADSTVHLGAVYRHQELAFRVVERPPNEALALVALEAAPVITYPKTQIDITLGTPLLTRSHGPVAEFFGPVRVTRQFTGYRTVHRPTGKTISDKQLLGAPSTLATKAIWLSLSAAELSALGIDQAQLPGALHAAEHAAIGLLPLFATCDRWDLGGISTALHPETGTPTIVVYDGQSGGAGFAERGFHILDEWLAATREVISTCPCTAGCPGCIQSPKCGNGNDPLDKLAALKVLSWVTEVRVGHPIGNTSLLDDGN